MFLSVKSGTVIHALLSVVYVRQNLLVKCHLVVIKEGVRSKVLLMGGGGGKWVGWWMEWGHH